MRWSYSFQRVVFAYVAGCSAYSLFQPYLQKEKDRGAEQTRSAPRDTEVVEVLVLLERNKVWFPATWED